MGRSRRVLLLVALALSPGCLGGPRLVLEDALAQSEAAHDGQGYAVTFRGRVVNAGQAEVRWVRVVAAVGPDCLAEPAEWPGFVDAGNLAPGASAPVRDAFRQEGPAFPAPVLWWRLTHTDRSLPAGKGCGALRVG